MDWLACQVVLRAGRHHSGPQRLRVHFGVVCLGGGFGRGGGSSSSLLRRGGSRFRLFLSGGGFGLGRFQLSLQLGDDLGVDGPLGLSQGSLECRLGLCCRGGSSLGLSGGGIGLGLSRGGGRFGLGLSGGGISVPSVRNADLVIAAT